MEGQKRGIRFDGSRCEFFRTKGNNTLVARSDTIIIIEEEGEGEGEGEGGRGSTELTSMPFSSAMSAAPVFPNSLTASASAGLSV